MNSCELSPVIESSSLIAKHSVPPVIVVGLPRSGSSYLSHVLSCMDDWFIFDDLYPYQKAASLGLLADTDIAQKPELITQYVSQLTWQLRAKIKFEKNFEVPNLSLDDVAAMEQALLQSLKQCSSLTWPQVLGEWITRLAIHSGKRRWGYKTPQDFMHMDELTDIFPGVRFIYILRDPRQVMRSFKNLPRVKTNGSQDGESRQYHPFVYALYWKIAYQKVQAFSRRNRGPVEVVRFEDLVSMPEATAQRLANFLETRVAGQVISPSVNSSLNKGTIRELTNTELLICEKIAGKQMKAAGYALSHPSPQLSDAVDLIKTTLDFAAYQIGRVVTNKRARTSVAAFVKNLGS
ncbi:MAG: Sulfotransferase family [Phormidesmis priestleyi Ana]|uniref:Sulfotransferase family n=1 Tax=Phormidesmis priestleyi Ana TaxID=1666911 RepID=A0A0P7YY15_9CYAN|nr:MAG: Sulfotransferase family [Phormidesmis priestleyi Ana]